MRKEFVVLYWFGSWSNINLGISLCLSKPNIEIHIPFGFIKIGWDTVHENAPANWHMMPFHHYFVGRSFINYPKPEGEEKKVGPTHRTDMREQVVSINPEFFAPKNTDVRKETE